MITRSTSGQRLVVPAIAILVICPSGCSKLELNKHIAWLAGETVVETPKTMTAMWTETVMQQPGQPSVRGLGGRIHFFADNADKPVKVDGTLTIYAFGADDDSKRVSPERKFVFLPEQIDSHRSDSSLGDSYSFWLPWEAVGGPQRKLSIIARFEAKTGHVILSEPAKIALRGEAAPEAQRTQTANATSRLPAAVPPNPAPVQPAAAWQPSEQYPTAGLPKTVTADFTIPVPPSFLRHMEGGNAAATSVEYPSGTIAATDANSPSISSGPQPAAPWPQRTTTNHPAAAPLNPAGVAPPLVAPAQPSARYESTRFPARNERAARPSLDRVRRQPLLARWPSPLPPTPQEGSADEATLSNPTAAQSVR